MKECVDKEWYKISRFVQMLVYLGSAHNLFGRILALTI